MEQRILIFLLLVLPLVINPFGPFSFETPKVILFELCVEILLLLCLYRKGFSFFSRENTLFKALIGGLFALSVVHIFFGVSAQPFFGNVFRLQGVWLLWHLLLLSLLSAGLALPKYAWKVALCSLSILCVFAFVFVSPDTGRAISLLGEPNALAASVLLLLPFCLVQKNKWVRLGSVLLAVVIVWVSGSRSGMIGLVVELLFLGMVFVGRISVGKSVIVGLILVVLSLWLPFLEQGRLYEDRVEIWQTSLAAGLPSPLLGVGFGEVQTAIRAEAYRVGNNLLFQVIDSSHNVLLDYWIQGGIVGVALFVALVSTAMYRLAKKKEALELTILLGTLVALLFNPVSIVTLIALWWVIGRGFSQGR